MKKNKQFKRPVTDKKLKGVTGGAYQAPAPAPAPGPAPGPASGPPSGPL